MTTKRIRLLATIPLGLFLVLCTPSPLKAEEVLEKGVSKYLGWVVSATKFRTCYGEEKERGSGSVQSTTRRCSFNQRLLENERRRIEGIPLIAIDDETGSAASAPGTLVANNAGAIVAMSAGGGGGPKMIDRSPYLSPDQANRIGSLRRASIENEEQLFARLTSIKQQIAANLLNEKPDDALALKLSKEMDDTGAEIFSNRAKLLRETIGVLTEEQKRLLRMQMQKAGPEADVMDLITRTLSSPHQILKR